MATMASEPSLPGIRLPTLPPLPPLLQPNKNFTKELPPTTNPASIARESPDSEFVDRLKAFIAAGFVSPPNQQERNQAQQAPTSEECLARANNNQYDHSEGVAFSPTGPHVESARQEVYARAVYRVDSISPLVYPSHRINSTSARVYAHSGHRVDSTNAPVYAHSGHRVDSTRPPVYATHRVESTSLIVHDQAGYRNESTGPPVSAGHDDLLYSRFDYPKPLDQLFKVFRELDRDNPGQWVMLGDGAMLLTKPIGMDPFRVEPEADEREVALEFFGMGNVEKQWTVRESNKLQGIEEKEGLYARWPVAKVAAVVGLVSHLK